MKILHTEASCGWGGQEIRILEESRGLRERGHEITIACPGHARIASEASRYDVPVTPLPIEFKTVAGFIAVRKLLATGTYDVVNTHSSADSWLTALACATLPTPPAIVRTRHVSAPVSANFANRWLYRQAKVVVTTGESLLKHLIRRLNLDPEGIVSIPTGIDTERFKPTTDKANAKKVVGLDPTHRHIGIVATLRSWKGHTFLLDAFGQLNRPDLRLLVVGTGPEGPDIEKKIASMNLSSQVILTGQRNDPENWLQALDVFCLPSYANEGVPQAILQAMLCGLPIVTTPVGAILEAVQNGVSAVIVPPRDSRLLAVAITRLLDDPEMGIELGTVARRVASAEYSHDLMLDGMEEVFVRAKNSKEA
jgi:glycosyltransferase involved in cell wall biosynthesis